MKFDFNDPWQRLENLETNLEATTDQLRRQAHMIQQITEYLTVVTQECQRLELQNRSLYRKLARMEKKYDTPKS